MQVIKFEVLIRYFYSRIPSLLKSVYECYSTSKKNHLELNIGLVAILCIGIGAVDLDFATSWSMYVADVMESFGSSQLNQFRVEEWKKWDGEKK